MRLITLLTLLLCIGCKEQQETEAPINPEANLETSTFKIPDVTTDKSALVYTNKNSSYSLAGEPYSGYMIARYEDGTLKEKTGIYKGKRQNESIKWYKDGRTNIIAHYNQGKLHGVKKLWSIDSTHTLVSSLNYLDGKAHGEQKQWYPSGEIYKVLNLNMGKEEGIQKAYRKNGELYANYEAVEGRIFGLKKAALCYGLAEEKINYGK